MPGIYFSRRDALKSAACGFGYLALAGLTSSRASAALNPLAPRLPLFPARAKRVIFLFMQGGLSQVDSFDYKLALIKQDGQKMTFDDARARANTGQTETSQRVMKSLWDFSQHGQCGKWASSLFPGINQHVDDLSFIHSMHTEGVAHGPATLFLHCGATSFIRPSMGSWVLYGLGTENENLPGFISIAPSAGNGGARNYGSAFLPAIYQGTPVGKAGGPSSDMIIGNLGNSEPVATQRRQLDLIERVNAAQLGSHAGDQELQATIESYELAARMQTHAPDVLDVSKESAATQALYGIGEKATDTYGRQCLMARRLAESGVRYIQVTYGDGSANPAWDQHSDIAKHGIHAKAVDKPIAGLLTDLKQRGLLDDTLVWFGSEFGRTPYAQANGTGRDHNPGGFTTWLAGGGAKPGFSFGATDDFGHLAVQDPVHMHDLHATILRLLGMDHEKLTYNYAGRNFRLTDVHGRIVSQVMA
jgi:hypothetical protein